MSIVMLNPIKHQSTCVRNHIYQTKTKVFQLALRLENFIGSYCHFNNIWYYLQLLAQICCFTCSMARCFTCSVLLFSCKVLGRFTCSLVCFICFHIAFHLLNCMNGFISLNIMLQLYILCVWNMFPLLKCKNVGRGKKFCILLCY